MPSRNRLKIYAPESYFHVYNRGVNKRKIYIDNQDYSVFLNLFKRHLSKAEVFDDKGRPYQHLFDEIEVIAYCLMPNHFHLFIYQKNPDSMKKLMQSISTSYVTYFNKKYGRRGPLFEDVYKASLVTDDSYFQHISRYIHLNPKNYKNWPYSSLDYYVGNKKSEWVKPEKVLNQFEDINEYLRFLEDYDSHKEMLSELKYELANQI